MTIDREACRRELVSLRGRAGMFGKTSACVNLISALGIAPDELHARIVKALRDMGNNRDALALVNAYAFDLTNAQPNLDSRRAAFGRSQVPPVFDTSTVKKWENRAIEGLLSRLLAPSRVPNVVEVDFGPDETDPSEWFVTVTADDAMPRHYMTSFGRPTYFFYSVEQFERDVRLLRLQVRFGDVSPLKAWFVTGKHGFDLMFAGSEDELVISETRGWVGYEGWYTNWEVSDPDRSKSYGIVWEW